MQRNIHKNSLREVINISMLAIRKGRNIRKVDSRKERCDVLRRIIDHVTKRTIEPPSPFWFHPPLSRSLSDNFSGLVAAAERHAEMDGSTVTSHLDSLNSSQNVALFRFQSVSLDSIEAIGLSV